MWLWLTGRLWQSVHKHVRRADARKLPSEGFSDHARRIPTIPGDRDLQNWPLSLQRPTHDSLPLHSLRLHFHVQEQSWHGWVDIVSNKNSENFSLLMLLIYDSIKKPFSPVAGTWNGGETVTLIILHHLVGRNTKKTIEAPGIHAIQCRCLWIWIPNGFNLG